MLQINNFKLSFIKETILMPWFEMQFAQLVKKNNKSARSISLTLWASVFYLAIYKLPQSFKLTLHCQLEVKPPPLPRPFTSSRSFHRSRLTRTPSYAGYYTLSNTCRQSQRYEIFSRILKAIQKYSKSSEDFRRCSTYSPIIYGSSPRINSENSCEVPSFMCTFLCFHCFKFSNSQKFDGFQVMLVIAQNISARREKSVCSRQEALAQSFQPTCVRVGRYTLPTRLQVLVKR